MKLGAWKSLKLAVMVGVAMMGMAACCSRSTRTPRSRSAVGAYLLRSPSDATPTVAVTHDGVSLGAF